MARKSVSGQRLTVVGEFRKPGDRAWWYYCLCECGNTHNIRRADFLGNHIRSCGCLREEANKTHGMSKTKEYRTWSSMIQRCQNPKHVQYKDYGGRGITVCPRWQTFERFYEDVGDIPTGFQLDRIENDKGYMKSNVTFSTRTQNVRNSRLVVRVRQLSLSGDEIAEFDTLTDAANAVGISVSKISQASAGKRKTAAGFKWERLQ